MARHLLPSMVPVILALLGTAAVPDAAMAGRRSHDRDHHDHHRHHSRSRFSFSVGFGNHHHWSHRYHDPWRHHWSSPTIIHRRVYSYPPTVIVDRQPQTVIVREPATTVVQQPTRPAVVTVPPSGVDYGPAPRTATGWELLSRDLPDVGGAINAFAAEAERLPNRGKARIGYALTQALVGNDEKAAWAMRQAVLRDPDALKSVPVDGIVAGHVRDLVARYQNRLNDGFSRTDDAFMLAALRFIQREYTAANEAITQALNNGDAEPTTAKLAEMIRKLVPAKPAE